MNKKNVDKTTLSPNDFTGEVTSAFTRMSAAIHTLSVLTSTETGLTLSELTASEHLRLDGPLTPKEISRRIRLSTGATTGMLDRLAQKGVIERRPHPTDRRALLIHYVEQNRRSDERFEKLQGLLTVRIGELTNNERELLLSFFHGVLADVDEASQ